MQRSYIPRQIEIKYFAIFADFIVRFFFCISDSELEELETTPRYRPDSLSALCRATRFSEAEIKRIYRGFKAECPTGVVKEDTFKIIYSQFFPQGGLYLSVFFYIHVPFFLFVLEIHNTSSNVIHAYRTLIQ